MEATPFHQNAHQGILHHIASTVYAFEYARPSTTATAEPVNSLLFIPGLYNTLLTPTYPTTLAAHLPPTWRLVRVALSSSGEAWGTKSLKTDADELAAVVRYFRHRQQITGGGVGGGGKIALMGHSTGCQDIMEYLVGGSSSSSSSSSHDALQQQRTIPQSSTQPVDAAILQAPVSDREALAMLMPAPLLAQTVAAARDYIAQGRAQETLPAALTSGALGPAPVSAARFVALALPPGGSTHEGEDDYFSSDLGSDRLEATFGRVPSGTRLQVLFGGADEYVPAWVDKRALVERWKGVMMEKEKKKKADGGVWDEDGGVVPGARHAVDGEGSADALADVAARVVRLLERL